MDPVAIIRSSSSAFPGPIAIAFPKRIRCRRRNNEVPDVIILCSTDTITDFATIDMGATNLTVHQGPVGDAFEVQSITGGSAISDFQPPECPRWRDTSQARDRLSSQRGAAQNEVATSVQKDWLQN